MKLEYVQTGNENCIKLHRLEDLQVQKLAGGNKLTQ